MQDPVLRFAISERSGSFVVLLARRLLGGSGDSGNAALALVFWSLCSLVVVPVLAVDRRLIQ